VTKPALEVGTELVAERTFTAEAVDAFTELSGDRGRHHLQADAQGRRIVHGLLVASLATEIGGRIDYLSRTMEFEFLRPVFVGDTVRCTARVDQVERKPGKTRLWITLRYQNQADEEVLRATTRGVVLEE